MKASVQDRELLARILPTEIGTYLRAAGWLVEQDREWSARYTKPAPDSTESFEIDVPMRADVRDYALRVRDILSTLEVAEARSQLDIATDIRNSTADTLRFSVPGSETSIPLEGGAWFVWQARELMLAAACAAIDPRPVFPGRKPAKALEFMSEARLTPPLHGSFVVLVETPVPPRLFERDEATGIPFTRLVTMTLTTAITEAQRATAVASARGAVAHFRELVPKGVSANLCDAIAQILEITRAPLFEYSCSWSPGRPLQSERPATARFSRDSSDILREAAKFFREESPRPDFEVSGVPNELSSSDPNQGGDVTVVAPIDGALRRVHFKLGGPEYGVAIRAHAQRLPIRCEGELARVGRNLTLLNPRHFQIQENDSRS